MRLLLATLILCAVAGLACAQDDTARLREGRIFVESLMADTLRHPLWRYDFYYDNPKLTSSQGRTTGITYWTDKIGRVQVIQTSQAVGQTIQQATYYLRQDSLLYATEEEILNLKSGEDHGAIVWSATYAFHDGKLVGLTSNGHGISESDDWQPEVSVPADFKRARTRVIAHARRRTAAR